MGGWVEIRRSGTMRAIERLGARADLREILGRFDAWLEAVDAPDGPDRGAVAIHPATGTLADALEAAGLREEAAFLRALAIETGPIRPGVWAVAQLLGRAAARRFLAGIVGQTGKTSALFGLESYGASDAFLLEVAQILGRDATARAAAAAETARMVADARRNPGRFAPFTQEREGVGEAVRAYLDEPEIDEAWETRLDGHVRFGSTLLTILATADTAEFLRQAGSLPHPAFAEQVLPDAPRLREGDLLCLLRDAPAAFDDVGAYQAAGMIAVRLLHRIGEKIRLVAWGDRGATPVPPGEQARLEPARAEAERVTARYLDALFTRTDAAFLGHAWLSRLIHEGEHRGHWRPDRRRGDGFVLDPLIMLIVALARRLEPRPDHEGWVRDALPTWRIERAMAVIAVRAFAAQPDRGALQGLLEWTLATLGPALPGAADAVLRSDGVIGRIGAYGLLATDRRGDRLMQLWQAARPLRERAWRTSPSDDDHPAVAQLLILWGLAAVEAAPPGIGQPLWAPLDAMLRDAAQVDRVAFHGAFWPNAMQRYGRNVARRPADAVDHAARLSQSVRCHVGPDEAFVRFTLAFVQAGGDRSLLRAAVTGVGEDLPTVLRRFLDRERIHAGRDRLDGPCLDEVRSLCESLAGHERTLPPGERPVRPSMTRPVPDDEPSRRRSRKARHRVSIP